MRSDEREQIRAEWHTVARRIRSERLAALVIRETADTLPPEDTSLVSLVREADGTIRASSHMAHTISDEGANEWMQYVTVNPDDTIEVGEVDLSLQDPKEPLIPVMRPFSLEDASAVACLVRQMRLPAASEA